jgi:hypothetical protein
MSQRQRDDGCGSSRHDRRGTALYRLLRIGGGDGAAWTGAARPLAAPWAGPACAILSGTNGIGIVTWCGLLPLMAGAVLLALTYGPRLARGGLLLALALMVVGAV